MGKTLVTGATGFIGSHVAEALCDHGVPCVLFVRDSTRLCTEIVNRADVCIGDIRDLQSLVTATRDCSSIIHIAGLANDWGNHEDFVSVNVQGTLNVLEACRINKISHVIITGSISSYGEENNSVLKDESSPFNSHYPYFLDSIFQSRLNWYRDTKAEATHRSLEFAKAHGLDLTIIEPTWVYGEREFNSGFYSYLNTVRQGLCFLPGSRQNTFHVIYARDLARAYVLAQKKRIKGIESILVGNPQPESMYRIFSLFCTQAGLRPPRLIPHSIAYPIGFALELFSTLFRTKKPPLLSRGRVNMFYDSIGYSVKKAERLLGFVSEYSLEQGIGKTVAWYRENGYLASA